MNKRQTILEHIKVAGYNNDHKTAIRLYVENRISYQAYQKAFRLGMELKAKGVTP